jgi:hypothetical protein
MADKRDYYEILGVGKKRQCGRAEKSLPQARHPTSPG